MGGPEADLEIDEKHPRRRRYRYRADWKAGSAILDYTGRAVAW
jgi:hypothetical protein